VNDTLILAQSIFNLAHWLAAARRLLGVIFIVIRVLDCSGKLTVRWRHEPRK